MPSPLRVLFSGPPLGVNAVAVCTVLFAYANHAGQCEMSVSHIAEKLDCSENRVRQALRELADREFIQIEAHFRADGGQLPNRYVIPQEDTKSLKKEHNAGGAS